MTMGKKSFLLRTAETLDLPGEVLAGQFVLTLTGNGRLALEGHGGILEYGSDLTAVRCGRLIAEIRGERLTVAAVSETALVLTGTVWEVSFRA